MHAALVGITFIIIMLLGTFICIGDREMTNKTYYLRLLWLIPLVGILFVFAKTSSCPDFDEIAKTSTEKWHTIYTNNINADVTVSTEHVTLNPKKSVTRDDKEKLFTTGTYIPLHFSSKTVTITATNKHDSTSKEAKLTEENFIEKWPKDTNPDKTNGRITKIEYRSTAIPLKWFGMIVEKTSYDEARITVEYKGTDDPSTKQLFGDK